MIRVDTLNRVRPGGLKPDSEPEAAAAAAAAAACLCHGPASPPGGRRPSRSGCGVRPLAP